jgi:hypothetical protein
MSVPVGNSEPDLKSQAGAIRAAVRAGDVKVIEWDHRALGGMIYLDRPNLAVGIGFEGLESFTVLTEIGRQDPAALERALGLVLSPLEPVPSPVG